MQSILVCAQSAATIQTSYFAATSPCVFASGLGTISVGATLSAVQALLQGIPSGCRLLTFTGSTLERQATWASSPNAIGAAPIGLGYFDTTLSAQLFSDGLTSSGWSSRTAAGV
jgi:hypothetical protein